MRVRIQKWGNSLAVRIPRSVAADTGLREGSEVDVVAQDGSVRIQPLNPRFDLSDLVRGIKPANRHGEIGFGSKQGGEAW